ncbi:hypothetical protein, partial [Streptomyces sp. NPDC002067]
ILLFNEPLPPLKLLAGTLIITGLIIGLYSKHLTPTTPPTHVNAGAGAHTNDGDTTPADDSAPTQPGTEARDEAEAEASSGDASDDGNNNTPIHSASQR